MKTDIMNSLEQYIDIYRENSEAIDAHSAPVMNAARPRALASLEGRRLPVLGDEGYEKTSVDDMMAADYGLNFNRVGIPVNVAASFRCGVPNMSTLLGVVVNDEFHPSKNLDEKLPDGVLYMSLKKAAELYPELVAPYYGRIASTDNVPVALNTLLAQDGVFVYVPAGVKVEKPLQLVNIFSSPTPLMAVRRMLVVVGDSASVQLLGCDHTQDCGQNYLALQVTEIVLGRDSRLDYYDLEESSENTARHSQIFASQDSGSSLLVNGMTLTCGTTRNDYFIDITGDGCDTLLTGMAIGSGRQHIDNSSVVVHTGTHCHSRQLFKYVLDNESTGAFEGCIRVDEGACFTEAYQSDRNLLASSAARMHTKPQLLIYCDDVKCSHGATTGQLDQDALFYMRSRGISEKTARTMLMEAFMAEVIDTVRMDGLRERLRMLVEKRFHGQSSFCGDCSGACIDTTSLQ
ncbi:MAG TPA: Fe-S cluster assembly protein SufD [Muribaculum sp.]|jgi:Fe-S cluster assembly protein SufD|uniref:Fe-S cluster assembly protein SufD n=1 Tax=Heminiphilus faecis TaxID=2601703 RepID=UPI001F38C802|nr:Fe-S cluster assembly protein SufD [Heminiphilus faecis]HRF69399.1 Fe-S cluster assembly protein SufD [Muribaculum sp.]